MLRGSTACWTAVAWLLLGIGSSAGVSAAPAREVVARVIDSNSGEPLSDVVIASGSSSATSDASGQFTITLAGDSALVTVRRIGYRPVVLHIADLGREIRLERAPVVLRSLQVTASGEPARHLATLSQLSLSITPREILAGYSAAATAEALESTEGVATSRPGSWGAKAYLRGLGGERVVVLLDGNRVNRACNMGMDAGLATVSPDNIERVEVLAGPGSTLYGSGNLGGVINVVTRGPRGEAGIQGELRASASSAIPGGRLGGTLWGRRDRFAFTASVDGASYGDQRSPLGTVASSSFRDGTIDLSGSYGAARTHRIEGRVQRYFGRDIGYPASGATIPEEDRTLVSLDYGSQLSRGALDGVNAKLYVHAVDHHMIVTMAMPATVSGGMPMRSETDARSSTETYGGRAQARLRPAAGLHLDAGFEGTQWIAEGTRWVERSGMGGTVRTEYRSWPGVRILDLGSFTQGTLAAAPWLDVSAGARLDAVRRSADRRDAITDWISSGNAGLRVSSPRGAYARAGIGIGYRIPDPTELYGLLLRPDGFLYTGNPDLRNETSRNLEVSAGWVGPSVRGSVTVFRNHISDFISTVVTGDSVAGTPVRAYGNVAEARLEGASASVSAEAARWLSLRGSLGATRGENRKTRAPLPMIPPFEARVAVRLSPAGRAWVEPEVSAMSRQTRAAAGEVRTPGFAVVNLRAGGSVGGTSITAGVENALDHAYRQHLDAARVLRPGRNLFVKVTRGFSG